MSVAPDTKRSADLRARQQPPAIYILSQRGTRDKPSTPGCRLQRSGGGRSGDAFVALPLPAT
jgi:hypothetical protein